jgi:hypothetical protein
LATALDIEGVVNFLSGIPIATLRKGFVDAGNLRKIFKEFTKVFLASGIVGRSSPLSQKVVDLSPIPLPVCVYQAFGIFAALSLIHEIPLQIDLPPVLWNFVLRGAFHVPFGEPEPSPEYAEKVRWIRKGFISVLPSMLFAQPPLFGWELAGVLRGRELNDSENIFGPDTRLGPEMQIKWFIEAVHNLRGQQRLLFIYLTIGSYLVPHIGLDGQQHPFTISVHADVSVITADPDTKIICLPRFATEEAVTEGLRLFLAQSDIDSV